VTAAVRFEELRTQIANNDQQILSLVNRRLDLVAAIWRLKDEMGVERHDESRERWLETYLCRCNRGPLSEAGVKQLTDFLLDLCQDEATKTAAPRHTAERIFCNGKLVDVVPRPLGPTCAGCGAVVRTVQAGDAPIPFAVVTGG
jgi:chorismate mutase